MTSLPFKQDGTLNKGAFLESFHLLNVLYNKPCENAMRVAKICKIAPENQNFVKLYLRYFKNEYKIISKGKTINL